MAAGKKHWTKELAVFVNNIANAGAGSKALTKALTLLGENGMTWDDLVRDLVANPPPGWADLVKCVDDMGSGDTGKRHDAVVKAYNLIRDELKRIEKNDPLDPPKMPGITFGWSNVVDKFKMPNLPPTVLIRPEVANAPKVAPAKLFHALVAVLKRYVWFPRRSLDHYYVLVVIWAWHTWMFRRFPVTPRLLIDAKFGESGKTAVLNFLRTFSHMPKQTKRMTAAGLRNWAVKGNSVIIDEGENIGDVLGEIRSIWDGAYERWSGDTKDSGKRDGENDELVMWCPMVIGGILEHLPWLNGRVLRRAFKIMIWRISKAEREERGWGRQIPDITMADPEAEGFNRMRLQLERWCLNCQDSDLNMDPDLPEGLTISGENNSRVFITIADAIDPSIGDIVRAACAHAEANSGTAEDPRITALRDLRRARDIFLREKVPGTDLSGPEYLLEGIEIEEERNLARARNRVYEHEGETFVQLTMHTIVAFFRRQDHGRWMAFAGAQNRGVQNPITNTTLGRLLGGLFIAETLWPSPKVHPSRPGYRFHRIERHTAGNLFEIYVDEGADLDDVATRTPKAPTAPGLTHRRRAIGRRVKPTREVSDGETPIITPPPRRKRRKVASPKRRKTTRRTYAAAASNRPPRKTRKATRRKATRRKVRR